MQLYRSFDVFPLWALFAATLIVNLLSVEAGFRVSKWSRRRSGNGQEKVAREVVGSMLGLEALILAFTFGAAMNHFDTRRQALLDQANTIKISYIQADLLPDPYRAEIRDLLREYVAVRLEGVRSGNIEQMIKRSEELHRRLWLLAIASKDKADSVFASQFIQSLSELISAHTRQVIAVLEFRIPTTIWIVLYAVTALATASIGYQSGLAVRSRSFTILMLILALSAVIYLIQDLDRPMRGFINVSQRAMSDLQRTMDEMR
ncbi:MAG: hypothetical protein J2P52_01555 [Blastocatellia bacterium]|nr:hypothetical protein [Blastocatellia bacterium]